MILSVDIGTSYSCACVLGPDGQAHPVEVSTGASMFGGQFSLPSAVFVEESGDILVGQAAMNSRKRKPENFRMEFKRNFGETYPILLGNRSFLPEELYTELLRHIKARAEQAAGEAVELSYLTHPATYGKARIETLRAAARAAGLFHVETVDEPTAAAMSYCAAGYIRDGQTLLVYDFGGGTFDVSLIRYENGAFTPLGDCEGLEQCGGIDMDRLIYQDMLRAVDAQTLATLQANPIYYMQFTSQLAELAVKAKHHLSAAKWFEEPIIVGFETIPYRLTVERFNQMIAPLVGQTIATCRLALSKAGLDSADLSAVLLVGGTSRVPLVQEMVRQFAGQVPVHCAPDLELAVAQGAINFRQVQERPAEPVQDELTQDEPVQDELTQDEPTPDDPTPEEIGAWYRQGLRLAEENAWGDAVPWLRKAAEHGSAEAQYNLGICYEIGAGVEEDLAQAAVWYNRAANRGDADAQFALGIFYERGRGVQADLEAAELLYDRAARQNHPRAAAALERLRADSEPVRTAKTPAAPERLRADSEPARTAKTAASTLNELAEAAVEDELEQHPRLTGGAAFFVPNPSKLRTYLNIPDAAEILLAHDDTVRQNGKNGFAVTSLGIYCRAIWEAPSFCSWQEFVSFDLDYNSDRPQNIYLKKGASGSSTRISYFIINSEPALLQELLSFWIGVQRRLRRDARRELGMDV